jgi:hypothetical protein
MPVRARALGASRLLLALLLSCGAAFATAVPAAAQEPTGPTPDRGRYILGEEKKLEMLVHVLGQVQRPGEYQVPDGTNALELISKAGGPTEFASMDEIQVTHAALGRVAPGSEPAGSRVVILNLSAFLASAVPSELPALQPGDVVNVPANAKSKWKFVSGILRDLAVVATAYFLGVRTFNY